MSVRRKRKQNNNNVNAQRSTRITGKGDYTEETLAIVNPIKRLESKLDHLEKKLVGKSAAVGSAASTIGRTLGNFVNQGDLGALAGSTLAKYFGHGDYSLKGNSLMQGKLSSGASFSNDGRRGTRVREREFVSNVRAGPLTGSSTDFTNASYTINPTNNNLFPWLYNFAELFDQWEPHGIVFEFVSTSSEYNGSSQALGVVVMATDYDSYDPAFATKQEMENSDYACSTKPSVGLVHGIECAVTERPSPVLYTSTDNGAPKTSYSLGNFQIATQGCSVADVVLGELWVSYDITFYKKQQPPNPRIYLSATGNAPVGSGLFSGVTTLSSLEITLDNITAPAVSTLNLPQVGRYAITYFMSAQAADTFALTAGTGVNLYSSRQVAIASNNVMYQKIVDNTIVGGTVTTASKVSSPSTWALAVARVNRNYTF